MVKSLQALETTMMHFKKSRDSSGKLCRTCPTAQPNSILATSSMMPRMETLMKSLLKQTEDNSPTLRPDTAIVSPVQEVLIIGSNPETPVSPLRRRTSIENRSETKTADEAIDRSSCKSPV